MVFVLLQKAEGRRKKAKIREQKVEDRVQKTNNRRQNTNSIRQKSWSYEPKLKVESLKQTTTASENVSISI